LSTNSGDYLIESDQNSSDSRALCRWHAHIPVCSDHQVFDFAPYDGYNRQYKNNLIVFDQFQSELIAYLLTEGKELCQIE
jgi:hypothetical protein